MRDVVIVAATAAVVLGAGLLGGRWLLRRSADDAATGLDRLEEAEPLSACPSPVPPASPP